MTVTPEMLAAYADGELDETQRGEVEQALAQDPALAREVAAHQALRARLSAHFAPILDAPLPEPLTRAVREAAPSRPADVISIETARARRDAKVAEASPAKPRRSIWTWGAGLALAASLTLAVVLERPAIVPASDYASGDLAAALESRPSGDGQGNVRVLLSFADAKGAFCRGYAGGQGQGIACRDTTGWRLERRFPAAAAQGTDYRQAGSENAALMAAIQDMAPQGAMSPEEEAQARASGWKR